MPVTMPSFNIGQKQNTQNNNKENKLESLSNSIYSYAQEKTDEILGLSELSFNSAEKNIQSFLNPTDSGFWGDDPIAYIRLSSEIKDMKIYSTNYLSGAAIRFPDQNLEFTYDNESMFIKFKDRNINFCYKIDSFTIDNCIYLKVYKFVRSGTYTYRRLEHPQYAVGLVISDVNHPDKFERVWISSQYVYEVINKKDVVGNYGPLDIDTAASKTKAKANGIDEFPDGTGKPPGNPDTGNTVTAEVEEWHKNPNFAEDIAMFEELYAPYTAFSMQSFKSIIGMPFHFMSNVDQRIYSML